jgi:hypothetical protein
MCVMPPAEPTRLTPRLVDMERSRLSQGYLATLPFNVAFMAGEGGLGYAFKVRVLQPPFLSNVSSYSFQASQLSSA